MRIMMLLKYLLGNRGAIETVARHPWSLSIGFLFVLSAGLAREYDQEYLIAEPWHALIPLGFSILASTLLATIFWIMPVKAETHRPRIQHAWGMFLSCFWMIAPMAWLYAIPFEQLMSAGDSTRANLTMLGVVAAWRVILMTRVVSVIIRIHPVAAFMVIMLFADTLVLTLLSIVPLPLFNIMGGIRLSESEQVIASMALQTQLLGILSFPIWLFGSMVAFRSRPDWGLLQTPPPPAERGWLRLTAAATIVLGLALLPLTQHEQRLRHHVEANLRSEKFVEALAVMSAHQPEDFPPHWDPPPRTGYRGQTVNVSAVAAAAEEKDVSPWVREVYAAKLNDDLVRRVLWYPQDWTSVAEQDVPHEDRLHRWRPHTNDLRLLLRLSQSLSNSDREAIGRLINAAEQTEAPSSPVAATQPAGSRADPGPQ